MTDNSGADAPENDGNVEDNSPPDGDQIQSDTAKSRSGRNGGDGPAQSGWEQIAEEFGDPEKVRKALSHARTWEQRAKENRDGAKQAQTLEQQLDEMRQQMSVREEKDRERSAKTANAQLKAELAQAGVKWDDVDEVLRPDPLTLLKDGEPDEDRIARIAAALARQAGRPAPDPDQGRRSNGAPPGDMNEMFRSKVRSLRN